MKKFFKGLLYLVVIAVVSGIGYQQYQQWQKRTDLAEQAASPQSKLPQWLTPTHYNLTLKIDPDNSAFSGKVMINVDLAKATEELWLHGENISASEASFTHADGTVTPLTYKEMGHSGVVKLSAAHELPPQNGQISISFAGSLASDLSGLYLVKEAGESYAFTQFEPNYARLAFPSFDEPRFKTPFDIALEVKQSYQGFANTPQIDEQQTANGFKRLTFKTTKPLPTYLIAVAVGDLDVIEHAAIPTSDIRDVEIPLRGIATKGKGKEMTYALANTASILATLENYFGMPYPYEKLDIVAVPDFAAGAMENAGLITYREQLLLLGDKPTLDQQRSYARVHAHELAHQWFGNLVTMPWWDDIWLNESFATWMADISMNNWNPEFGFERAMVRSGHGVMNSDVYIDTRQIREPIKNNGDIESAFDGITYQKGGAVLQMLEDYIGKQAFKEGVRYHLKQYAFGHANAIQFIESIEKNSDKANIKAAFESFLNQKGVPLVNVNYQCSEQGNTVTFEQSRYLPVGAGSSSAQTWTMPVCITTIGETGQNKQCQMLTQPIETFALTTDQCPLAIMPNNQGKGYYRWSLSHQQQSALMAQFDKLSAAEKYTVASNLAAEFKAGRIDASHYLAAIKPIIADTDWDLISQPVGTIKFISNNIATKQEKGEISAYLSSLYQPKLADIGLYANTSFDKDNPVETKLLRKTLINLVALTLEQPELLNELAAMGKTLIGFEGDGQLNIDAVEVELMAPALASGVKVYGQPFAQALIAQLDNTDDGTIRQRLLVALGRSKDPQISAMVLDLMTSLSLRVNERLTLLGSHMSQKENQQGVYQWLKDKYGFIAMVIPKKYLAMAPIIGAGFCSKEMRNDVETFFKAKLEDNPASERYLSTTLEKIEMCVALKESQMEVSI
ncbi:M1 family metallopeptidase [Thalassotalea sp. G2M2-11]|uniref:M1 family metallopeptidase n=1 Tax=Thalassotalea sp. G2M2-11 TaxID=2787627 RepID=UPI0019D21EB6|nr:M1 family metallopeptidase [Thalassotalea sp. G2M2-11]